MQRIILIFILTFSAYSQDRFLAGLEEMATTGEAQEVDQIEQPKEEVAVKVEEKEAEPEKKKTPLELYDIGFYVGHSFTGSAYTIEGVDATFKGQNFRLGIRKNIGKHKFRLGYEQIDGYADTIEIEGVTYNIGSAGITIDYDASGFSFGYTYEATPHLGLGAYYKSLSGSATACGISCKTSDLDITEVGFRIEGKVGYWNPYLELGSSSFKETGAVYNGASAYIGLINFEF